MARREWPHLRLGHGAISSRLIRIGRLLERRYEEVLAPFSLRLNDLEILGALRRAGTPITPTALGRYLLLSSTTMTTRVDRLEHLGYVERRALADSATRNEPGVSGDRRTVLVSLTADGNAALDQVMPVYVEAVANSLAALSPDDRHVMESPLRRLLSSIDPNVVEARLDGSAHSSGR